MAKQQSIAILPKEEVQIVDRTNPSYLLSMAVEKGLGLDQLEKLMALQERWETKEARKHYYMAFSKFQGIMPDLEKNREVKFVNSVGKETKYNFQELSDIAKHIRPALAECGLSYRWVQSETGNEISVTCIVSHIEGHEERGEPLKGQYDNSGSKNLIQQKASTITYLKRYTLMGALGLSTGENDDDGKGGKKDKETGLVAPTQDQFNKAMKGVIAGTYTLEAIKAKWTLTEDQENGIKTAIEASKNK